jgi:hypothetical protein
MPELSLPLSSNFTLGELLHSNSAERDESLKREQENPPDEITNNLRHLVETALQPIRTRLDYPLRINSGYRSPLLNKIVGGSATSQHCRGEAADCELSRNFLTDPAMANVRNQIESGVLEITGSPLRQDVNANFYLFAFICLNLNDLDVDQVIHEYGEDFGLPSWVHVSSSVRQDKRQILFVGNYTNKRYLNLSVEEALSHGTSV